MELNCRGCKAPLPLLEENTSKVIVCEWCRATNPNPLFREKPAMPQESRPTPVPQESAPTHTPPQSMAPPFKLVANYNAFGFIFLSIITLGIYTIIWHNRLSKDINTMVCHHDGKRTWNGAVILIITMITAAFTYGIPWFIWHHMTANRIGTELRRRRIKCTLGAKDFWIWCILGAFVLIGPIVYAYKVCRAMNALIMDYNQNW